MNLARNSFSLRKCQSFAVPATVMSNLREGHLGLRFAQQRGLGDLIFRSWTSHSENSSLSRMCQCRPSGKEAQTVYKPSPHLFFLQYHIPGDQIFGCFVHIMRGGFSSSSQLLCRSHCGHDWILNLWREMCFVQVGVVALSAAGSFGGHGLSEVLKHGTAAPRSTDKARLGWFLSCLVKIRVQGFTLIVNWKSR